MHAHTHMFSHIHRTLWQQKWRKTIHTCQHAFLFHKTVNTWGTSQQRNEWDNNNNKKSGPQLYSGEKSWHITAQVVTSRTLCPSSTAYYHKEDGRLLPLCMWFRLPWAEKKWQILTKFNMHLSNHNRSYIHDLHSMKYPKQHLQTPWNTQKESNFHSN